MTKKEEENKILSKLFDDSYIWLEKRKVAEMFNYEFQTSFWEDLALCERYWRINGDDGILEYYNNAIEASESNYRMLTELALVLSWKTWKYFGKIDDLGRLYEGLMTKTTDYAMNNLEDDELDYFLRETN